MAELYIGLMSGTSMDALDAVLVDFEPNRTRLLASSSTPLPKELRNQLLALTTPGENELERCAQADLAFGRFSATIVTQLLERTDTPAREVSAIGSHGQTIRHAPNASPPYTIQIGDGDTLAQLSGITVINDFRRRDMVVGGQGAPLVPAFHSALYRDHKRDKVVLNLGGIANISILPAAPDAPVTGFDTGPGNTLMDSWCQERFGEPFDDDGQRASRGSILQPLLERLLQDPYFAQTPPKSTGREHFNLPWLRPLLPTAYSDEEILATLCELTARSVAQAIDAHCPQAAEVIICGGGAYNHQLIKRLETHLPAAKILSSASTGIEPRWMEGMAFAWLARQTLSGLAGNLPAVTGAREAVILGAIHPRPQS